jgi:hypothetical protein
MAEGGHFVPHSDTPHGSDMLGTLVCLPSQPRMERSPSSTCVFRPMISRRSANRRADAHPLGRLFGDVDHQIELVEVCA